MCISHIKHVSIQISCCLAGSCSTGPHRAETRCEGHPAQRLCSKAREAGLEGGFPRDRTVLSMSSRASLQCEHVSD